MCVCVCVCLNDDFCVSQPNERSQIEFIEKSPSLLLFVLFFTDDDDDDDDDEPVLSYEIRAYCERIVK